MYIIIFFLKYFFFKSKEKLPVFATENSKDPDPRRRLIRVCTVYLCLINRTEGINGLTESAREVCRSYTCNMYHVISISLFIVLLIWLFYVFANMCSAWQRKLSLLRIDSDMKIKVYSFINPIKSDRTR